MYYSFSQAILENSQWFPKFEVQNIFIERKRYALKKVNWTTVTHTAMIFLLGLVFPIGGSRYRGHRLREGHPHVTQKVTKCFTLRRSCNSKQSNMQLDYMEINSILMYIYIQMFIWSYQSKMQKEFKSKINTKTTNSKCINFKRNKNKYYRFPILCHTIIIWISI